MDRENENTVDVFISYKQDERDRMWPLAEGLRALKVKVWFDEQLGPDKTFTDEIAEVIQNCKAQLVCWSPSSVRSDWVRGEAHIGRRRGVLVAVMIERCELPAPFNMHHAEDLSGWSGATDHAGWHKVVEAIGRKLQRPGLEEPAPLQASSDAQAWKRWAETYPDDPFVEDAWAKAEDLDINQFWPVTRGSRSSDGDTVHLKVNPATSFLVKTSPQIPLAFYFAPTNRAVHCLPTSTYMPSSPNSGPLSSSNCSGFIGKDNVTASSRVRKNQCAQVIRPMITRSLRVRDGR